MDAENLEKYAMMEMFNQEMDAHQLVKLNNTFPVLEGVFKIMIFALQFVEMDIEFKVMKVAMMEI